MEQTLYLIVSLWLKGDVAAFEEFERDAASLMAEHGGRIEIAVRSSAEVVGEGGPFEVHVVSFPDEAAYEAYRDDPRVRARAALRERVIARTEVVRGWRVFPREVGS